jgi:hypothetical protein
MHIRNRLTGIETNLDDLQAGVDAGLREVRRFQKTAGSMDRLGPKPLASADRAGSLVRHARALEACVRDQRGALHELRAAVAHLRNEMVGATAAARPRLATAADRRR